MDFIEAKAGAAREIALAFGVPPLLLGLPGDNTYANYAEASRAFWLQTVIPLVARTQKSFSSWLEPAFGRFTLDYDVDRIEALAEERAAEWTRIGAADFLSVDEKRAAVGYGAGTAGATLHSGQLSARRSQKLFRADQPRLPRGPNGGQWTNGSGNDALIINVADRSDDDRNYTVDLRQEEAPNGIGHTIRDHVGKSDDELLKVEKFDWVGTYSANTKTTVFRDAEGSFDSVDSANDFVNRTLATTKEAIDSFITSSDKDMIIDKRFGYRTGSEATRSNADASPYIRDTYGVRVVLRRGENHDFRVLLLSQSIGWSRRMQVPDMFPRFGVRFDPDLRELIPPGQDPVIFALDQLNESDKLLLKNFLLRVLAAPREPGLLEEVWAQARSRIRFYSEDELRAFLRNVVEIIDGPGETGPWVKMTPAEIEELMSKRQESPK